MWNERTLSKQVYIQQWFNDERTANIYVKLNVFSVIRNGFGIWLFAGGWPYL